MRCYAEWDTESLSGMGERSENSRHLRARLLVKQEEGNHIQS